MQWLFLGYTRIFGALKAIILLIYVSTVMEMGLVAHDCCRWKVDLLLVKIPDVCRFHAVDGQLLTADGTVRTFGNIFISLAKVICKDRRLTPNCETSRRVVTLGSSMISSATRPYCLPSWCRPTGKSTPKFTLRQQHSAKNQNNYAFLSSIAIHVLLMRILYLFTSLMSKQNGPLPPFSKIIVLPMRW